MSVSGVATMVAGVVAAAAVGVAAVLHPAMMPNLLAPPVAQDGATSTKPAPSTRAEARSFVVVATPKSRSLRSARGAPSTATSSAAAPATTVPMCASLNGQRDVEIALSSLKEYNAIVVDGRQSPGDCALIRRFQQRSGIRPANGQADSTTADVGHRIAVASTPARQRQCHAGDGVTACVDLSSQTAWVVRDGEVTFGPTVVRTGFRGHVTPTGTYRINKRELREWSDPYSVWLPYWQRFNDGIGFHETTTYIHDGTLGSHGCVNLLPADAVVIWHQLKLGATVRTFGRRPGT